MDVNQAYLAYCQENGINPDGQFSEEDGVPLFQAGWHAREPELAELRGTIASLRQHKNEYMDAAEETRKALQAELAAMREQPVPRQTYDHYVAVPEQPEPPRVNYDAPSQVAAEVVQVPRRLLEDAHDWLREYASPNTRSYRVAAELRALLATRQADGGEA